MKTPDIVGDYPDLPPANVILLGLPGSGKTTLGELMQESNPDLRYISVGQISRDLPAGDERRSYVDSLYTEHNGPVGHPDFFVELVRSSIKRARQEGKGIILDGIPKKPEEVEPLNKLLEDEGVKIDGIVICEVSPFTALKRVIDRGPREGGLDTVDTAINRGEAYWKAVDYFKKKLGGFLETKIITVDTENMNPASALIKANEVLGGIRRREANANVIDIQTNEITVSDEMLGDFAEAIELGDEQRIGSLVADIFLDSSSHKEIVNASFESGKNWEMQDAIRGYLDASKDYDNLPLLKERYAVMIENSVMQPLQHLAKSIPQEALLRSGGVLDKQHLSKVITEALVTKQIIATYQNKANAIADAEEYVNAEFEARKDDIGYIESYLRDGGALQNGTSLRGLMALQPSYWNILTSSVLVGSVDGNYQKHINSIPGSHHSLSAPIDMPRRLIANSIGEYQPFIEAVSTSERSGFDTSLGFLHVVGIDEAGKAFQVEWPLLMQDSRLAAHPNALLRDMLARGQEIYFNHDFWHNIVPVYAESFNLYHPHAPIAYGGVGKEYQNFGKALRTEKEEYEIFVAKTHAEAQQYRMLQDPEYEDSQIQAVLTIVNDMPHLRKQLIESDGIDFADNVTKYLMTVTVGRLLNVVPPDSPSLKVIIDKIDQEESLHQQVSRQDLLKLLFTQRMALATKDSRLSFMQEILALPDVSEDIRSKIIADLMPSINNIERKPALSGRLIEELCMHDEIVAVALKYVEPSNSYAESGAEELYEALVAIGLKDVIHGKEAQAELAGISLLRWLAIVAPQRDPLKGHMEKVHGKETLRFGDEELKPTEIVKRHIDAFNKDRHIYEYRRWAREFGQTLAVDVYDLLLNDGQEKSKNPRAALYILSHFDGSEEYQKEIVMRAVQTLDEMLDDLVAAKYGLNEESIKKIENLIVIAQQFSPELADSIKDIVRRYRFLQQQELAYQSYGETSYADSKANLENSTMSLFDQN